MRSECYELTAPCSQLTSVSGQLGHMDEIHIGTFRSPGFRMSEDLVAVVQRFSKRSIYFGSKRKTVTLYLFPIKHTIRFFQHRPSFGTKLLCDILRLSENCVISISSPLLPMFHYDSVISRANTRAGKFTRYYLHKHVINQSLCGLLVCCLKPHSSCMTAVEFCFIAIFLDTMTTLILCVIAALYYQIS